MDYLGHSENDKGKVQTLEDHTDGVVALVYGILTQWQVDPYTLWLGVQLAVNHDTGKAQHPFFSWLTDRRERSPHEIYSARCLLERCRDQGIPDEDVLYLIYLVANHHRGLHEEIVHLMGDARQGREGRITTVRAPRTLGYLLSEWDAFKDDIFEDNLAEVIAWTQHFEWNQVMPPPDAPTDWDLFRSIRIAQGAFNYGDCVDTAGFYGTDPPDPFDRTALTSLSITCDAIRKGYQEDQDDTDPKILALRNALYERCSKYFLGRFLTISACTGSGKTLAALKLAASLRAERVIYVLPFLSIVEQVAKFIREVDLGVPVEHVSVPSSEFTSEEDREENRGNLADWNAPFVITTTERLSQLLVGRKGVDARRFLALLDPGTVVIIDEVQSIPPHKLYAYVRILERLGCKVILMSATLESGEDVLRRAGIPFTQVTPPGSLPVIPPRRRFRFIMLHQKLPNVSGEMTKLGVDSALSIYNTIPLAKKAYLRAKIPDSYLLTSNLCSLHRLEMLAEIQNRLKLKMPVVVFSTQVIQCGVDISFPLVIRQIAPYADVLQGAGRDNRHGEFGPLGGTVVIWAWFENHHPLMFPDDEYKARADIFRDVLLKRGCPQDDDGMEALAPSITREEVTKLGVTQQCSEVDSYVAGTELLFPKIKDLTHIPKKDNKVQTLVDYPRGTVQKVLRGQVSRSEFHLHTVEAREDSPLNTKMTLTYLNETKPSQIYVWGNGDPFDPKWDSFYTLHMGRQDPPKKGA